MKKLLFSLFFFPLIVIGQVLQLEQGDWMIYSMEPDVERFNPYVARLQIGFELNGKSINQGKTRLNFSLLKRMNPPKALTKWPNLVGHFYENWDSQIGPSIFGDSVWVTGNSLLLQNIDSDTIRFYFDNILGLNRPFFQNDSIKVESEIVEVIPDSNFISFTDTVFKIRLHVKQSNFDSLQIDAIENLEISYSKKIGFLKALDFYLFPHFPCRYQERILLPFYLISSNYFNSSRSTFSRLTIYDFEVYDEFMYEVSKVDNNHSLIYTEKNTVLERVENSNNVAYKIKVDENGIRYPSKEVHQKSNIISLNVDKNSNQIIPLNLKATQGGGCYELGELFYLNSMSGFFEKDCYDFDGYSGGYKAYANGIGLVYEYYWQEPQALGWERVTKELTHYKKSTEAWVYINESQAIREPTHFFPNPSNGRIFFTSEVVNLKLFDIQGKLVYYKDQRLNSIELDLPKGFYFLQFSQSGQAYSQKLIIE